MKHRLQWKFIGIMLMSLFAGIAVMAVAQAVIFTGIYHMTPEEGEIAFAKQSYLFDLLFLVTTILTFLLLSRKILSRIERMNDNIQKITKGQMRDLSVDTVKDELGSLSIHINSMAEQIDESLQKEKNMVCNLAHDLRTPVTSICGYVELLKNTDGLSKQQNEYADILLRKGNELSNQIDDLLEYSLLTFQEKEYEMQRLSLSSLMEQVLIDFIPMLEKDHFRYEIKGNSKPCMCNGNQRLLIRLFENLITNSIRYGKEDKKIEIELKELKNSILVDIANYGAPLSDEELEHLFDALYQGESAKQYQMQSKGLGLSIAKEIVKIHHGIIEVKNDRTNHKILFEVVLPCT